MLDLFLVPLAAALLVGTATTPIADVFVDGSAANCATGTGSAVDPVCSITAAIAIAAPGDTVRIAPGTYVENVVIGIDLELVGTGGAAVTIVDGGANGSVVTIPVPVTVGIDGLSIVNGLAITRGGGVLADAGAGTNLTITNSSIRGNLVNGYATSGGGVYISGGDLAVRNSTISGNDCVETFFGYYYYSSAFSLGGGIFAFQADLEVSGSTISDNTTYGDVGNYFQGGGLGAGISAWASLVKVSNTTISGNSCFENAGLDLYNSLPGSSISNTTITGNIASLLLPGGYNIGIGGGLRVRNGNTTLHNTIVAQNFSGSSSNQWNDVVGTLTSLGYNVIGTGAAGIVNGVNGDLSGNAANPLDARLRPLQDNGGPTQTHAISFGSPAMSAADPLSFEPFDQRGIARPDGGFPDIGAYESDGIAPSFCNGDGGNQAGCTNCPCGNNAAIGTLGGCLNSAATSAFLLGTGNVSVTSPPMSANDLRFGLFGAPATTLCVLLSGDSIAPANPAAFCFGQNSGTVSLAFDGLRCADLNLRRHGARTSNSQGQVGATNSPWGGEGNPVLGIAQAFGGFAAGDTRYFQVVYRDNPLAVCSRGLNTSQAVEVVFTR